MALLAQQLAAQTCTPPTGIKARLREKPTAAVFNDLGVWFGAHEQYACAADAFGSSLQAEPAQPDLPHVIFEFGSSLYLSGDIKEAVPSLQEAERLGYRDRRLHVILASALDATHDTPAAAAQWRKALAFDPDDTTALDALSTDLLAAGDNPGVIELLDRPYLNAWRSAQQALNLGAAYQKTGKPDDALRVLQDGLNTNPDSYELAQQLAAALAQAGRADQAAKVRELAESRRQQTATGK